MVINCAGKVRLCQFYEKNCVSNALQQELMRDLHIFISARSDSLCYFVDGYAKWPSPDTRIVYRRYATLCIIFVTDSSESCLAILDLIQVFVEVLDRLFRNVCELDFLFHSEKVQRALMEIVMGGMVLEMSKETVVRHLNESNRIANSGSVTTSQGPGGVGAGLPSPSGGAGSGGEAAGGLASPFSTALNLLWGGG